MEFTPYRRPRFGKNRPQRLIDVRTIADHRLAKTGMLNLPKCVKQCGGTVVLVTLDIMATTFGKVHSASSGTS